MYYPSQGICLYVYMACIMCCPNLLQIFFLAETRKVFLSFFFYQNKVMQKGRSAWPLSGIFFWTKISKSFPEIFFLCAKKCFNCFDQIGFLSFLGTWLKTYQTKYFNELGHFWLWSKCFIGFLGTRLRATRSLWDLHRSWS